MSSSDRTMALREGTVLNGKYRITGVIGAGGFGITYRGESLADGTECAIKELFINNAATRARDGLTVIPNDDKRRIFDHGISRFIEEASILQKLNGTKNIVGINDYFEENNTAYFAMNFIEGSTLTSLMQQKGGRLPLNEAVDIISSVGDTLALVYDRYQIVHRDVSPENILIDGRGNPVLIDFGNAKNYIRSKDKVLSIVLKPGFAPPEQYTGKDQGPWTDVYSLGSTFYYAVTGRKVLPAPDRVIQDENPALADVLHGCPSHISAAVSRAIAVNPKDRFRRTDEFVRALTGRAGAETIMPQSAMPEFGGKESPVAGQQITVYVLGAAVEKWFIPGGVEITAGRSGSESNLLVSRDYVSGKHLRIRYNVETEDFTITDFSRNGTFMNGTRLENGRRFDVPKGTVLSLGNDSCQLKLGV